MLSRSALVLLLIFATISHLAASTQVDDEIVLATTTSVRDTELLDALLRRFRESSEYRVKVIAVGSGQAMELGRRGEADILILHDPDGERQFVRRGYGTRRDPLMRNEFVIVGPPEDPAGLRGLSPVAAVRSVATACGGVAVTCLFVSRADRSGTHTKEQTLWRRAAITPDRLWYRESGQGMSATLQIANELRAYVLTDIGTLLSHRSPLDLLVLVQGDTALHNPYHVVTVNAERFPWINTAGAEALREFLLSRRAQDLISAFGRTEFGRALFRPAVSRRLPPSPAVSRYLPAMPKLRLMIAQMRPKKGDYVENLRWVGGVFAQVGGMDEPPGLIVFPEAALTGYFLEGGVRELALSAGTLFRDLAAQHSLSGAPPVDVALGFYEEFQNRYYNSALYASLGGAEPGIRHVHRKIFLPTYGVFDEERFVEHGHSVSAFDIAWGRAAMVVCEDAWHSLVPTLAALDGAQLIIIPSASPARGIGPDSERVGDTESRPASVRRWESVLERIADEHGVYVAAAQLAGFEGGKGLQGSSVVIGPQGDVLVRGPLFEDALLLAELDLDEVTRARYEQPLLADLETQLLNLLRSRDSGQRTAAPFDPEDECPRTVKPAATHDHQVITSSLDGDTMEIDPALTERWLVEFLKDEVVRRRGYTKGIVGLSGGVDSSTTAALAARALGPKNVIGVRMPYRTSSQESLEHAELVAKQLGITLETVDITQAVDGYIDAADRDADPTRRGNVMARMRMVALFDLSARLKALPLGTGNKTERLMGYFTWHADDSPPVNPLGDLFKTQVRELARHVGVPDAIIEKPATADLVQGQTDEGDLGISYEKADGILHWLLKGLRHRDIVARGYTPAEVELVSRRLHATHWKRRIPTVAMVSSTAIGESYLRPVDY